MKLDLFIARKIRNKENSDRTVSSRIIKIAILAVSLGIVLILISISVGFGFQEKIKEKTKAFSGDSIIIPFENNSSVISSNPISANELLSPDVLLNDFLESYHLIINKAGIIKFKNEFDGIIFKGIDKNFNKKNTLFSNFLGSNLSFNDEISNQILLSKYVANKLSIKIGDKLELYFDFDKSLFPVKRNFILSGIYETGFNEYDENYGFVDVRHLQKINKWNPNQYGGIEIFYKKNIDNSSFSKLLYNNLPSDLDLIKLEDRYKTIFDWIKLFDFNILIIILIVFIVATLNMSTALLTLILEKTKTIGILKSIGANNYLLQKIFLWNGLFILLKGVFFGNLIGLLLIFIQKSFGLIKLDSSIYILDKVPVIIDFKNILFVNFGIIFVCMISLVIPSLIISRISPSKVIRIQ